MTSSTAEVVVPQATDVRVRDDALCVELSDGRTITVPLSWYPRLEHGTPSERGRRRLIADGEGIHWPDLDEDIRVAALLAGARSSESSKSLRDWLRRRTRA